MSLAESCNTGLIIYFGKKGHAFLEVIGNERRPNLIIHEMHPFQWRSLVTYKKKTWMEKLEDKEGYPKILKLEAGFPCYKALTGMGAREGDDVVLTNPGEVVAIMRRVPEGKLITLREICEAIARQHGVKACCTLTAGIFVMTAANAAAGAAKEGNDLEIPYWRTLKIGGFLNEKYPGGEEGHKALLEKEGHEVLAKGKKHYVKDYQRDLVTIK
jgi:alkylated DNA nucleotide flippase Atl1